MAVKPLFAVCYKIGPLQWKAPHAARPLPVRPAALLLPVTPANAVVLDLYTMTCKQFVESDKDTNLMVLTWLDGWYKGDSDEATIDTELFVENAKKFGSFSGANPR